MQIVKSAFTDGFFKPVKPRRCTPRPVEPLNGINKDVCGAKLQPTTVSAYPSDHLCHLVNTQYCCLCLSGSLNPPPAAHPPTPTPMLSPPTHPSTTYPILSPTLRLPPPPSDYLPHPLICVIHIITVTVRRVA